MLFLGILHIDKGTFSIDLNIQQVTPVLMEIITQLINSKLYKICKTKSLQ